MQLTIRRRVRVAAGLAAAAVPLAMLATVAPHSDAVAPTGSVYPIFLETGTLTGNPANAVGSGFWGHEGATHDQSTITSANMYDGGQAVLNAFGTSDFNNLAVAFVQTSADGSTERPTITAGENLGQAFKWFSPIGLGTAMSGSSNPANNSVMTVSTLAEYQAWITDGKPAQNASSNDLVMHDVLRSGNPVSAHPKGQSILDRWAAGQNISLVVVKTTGAKDAATGLPIVAADASGHAVTSWLNFTTKADAAIGDASHPGVATSGGYTLTADSAPSALKITTLAHPAVTEGVAATAYAMKTTGGTGANHWSITKGSLPTGLKISSTGSITGTPLCATVSTPTCPVATSTFTVSVTDSSKPAKTTSANMTITVKPMSITIPVIKTGRVQTAFTTATFKAVGGGTPLSWTATGLPAGMKMATTGAVSGTPTVAGTFPITVNVVNTKATYRHATAHATIVIAPMEIKPVTPKAGKVGVAYSLAETTVGGKGTKVWSVSGGTLPPGLKITSTSGALSGKPTVAGTFTFTVSVHDAATPQNTATATYTIVVTS